VTKEAKESVAMREEQQGGRKRTRCNHRCVKKLRREMPADRRFRALNVALATVQRAEA